LVKCCGVPIVIRINSAKAALNSAKIQMGFSFNEKIITINKTPKGDLNNGTHRRND
jgi:hypothetical protein